MRRKGMGRLRLRYRRAWNMAGCDQSLGYSSLFLIMEEIVQLPAQVAYPCRPRFGGFIPGSHCLDIHRLIHPA
jgi:hypothetical protein